LVAELLQRHTSELWLASGRLIFTRFLPQVQVEGRRIDSLHFCLTRDGIKPLTRQTSLWRWMCMPFTCLKALSAPSISHHLPSHFSPTIVQQWMQQLISPMPRRLWTSQISDSSSCKQQTSTKMPKLKEYCLQSIGGYHHFPPH
jgi:hypothetical protein